MRPHDLKLLVIFNAIMTENSMTRAAEQLSMTQPAVSNAVSRMRILWKDDLFVPDGRNIQPTTHAINLWNKIRDSLHNLNQAVDPNEFSPNTVQRTFRVALPDIALDMLWAELRLLFEQQAPGLNLHAVPYTIGGTKQVLDDGEVDLVIGQSNRSLANISTEHLFDTSYVCVMGKNHPLASSKLTVADFAAAEHLLVTLSGDSASPTDQTLHQLGLSRRVAFTVNHFSSAIPIIKKSNLIAILPPELVHSSMENDELSISHPPLDIPHTSISMLWHQRQNSDEGLMWLCQHIKKIFVKRRTQMIEEVYKYFNL